MNVRRGLFRAWLVGSVLFAAAVLAYSTPAILDQFDPARHYPGDWLEASKVTHPWQLVAETAGIAFGGPIALLALGVSVAWVVSGFRPVN